MFKTKNSFIIKYKEIIIKIIQKSFPLLGDKKIYLWERKSVKGSADAGKRFIFWRVIRVHPRLRNYSEKNLMGAFAHELSHLEDIELYHHYRSIFKKSKEKREKNTDRRAIEKGYAKELHEHRSVIYAETENDKRRKKMRKFYLSPDEIKSYAELIGRWG